MDSLWITYSYGKSEKYAYLQGKGKAANGQAEYVLEFEPLFAENSIELYIKLKKGEKITISIEVPLF